MELPRLRPSELDTRLESLDKPGMRRPYRLASNLPILEDGCPGEIAGAFGLFEMWSLLRTPQSP
jgi:hypothetical protein